MKIRFFPRYTDKGASSRYRIYQYLPFFIADGYVIKVSPFFDYKYKMGMSFKSIKGVIYVLRSYFVRIIKMIELVRGRSLVFLQYQFTPFLPFNTLFFKVFRIKYIVDYDDAVFHNYDKHKNWLIRFLFKNKIPRVMTNAKAVITGSPYLTEFAKNFNDNVIEIPTSIDIQKYQLTSLSKNTDKKLTIGWIGSSTTSLHLRLIVDALKHLKKEDVDFELSLIGYDQKEGIDFKGLPVNFVKWRAETEIEELSKFDVGIMPLVDFPFARGKCAFKLIQYMAMGKPTISSSFAANKKVDKLNQNLFADNTNEWLNCFKEIYNNRDYFVEVGRQNREIIRNEYSIQANYKKIKEIINNSI